MPAVRRVFEGIVGLRRGSTTKLMALLLFARREATRVRSASSPFLQRWSTFTANGFTLSALWMSLYWQSIPYTTLVSLTQNELKAPVVTAAVQKSVTALLREGCKISFRARVCSQHPHALTDIHSINSLLGFQQRHGAIKATGIHLHCGLKMFGHNSLGQQGCLASL